MSEKQTIGGIAPKAITPAPIAEEKPIKESVIRTMQKDMDSLLERDFVKPPKDLPIEEKGAKEKKEKAVVQKETEERLRKKEEQKKQKAEELRREEEAKRKKQAEKLRKKEEANNIKKEKLAKKRAIQEQKRKAMALKILAFKAWIKANSSVLLKFSYAVILVIGIIGGFFYWWNYIKMVVPPVAVTHYQCQDFQCVSVEGEGTDECQTEQDCQPAEPEVPQPLIPVDGTETIEIESMSKELFIQELELILTKDEEENILNNILVKISNQTEKEYVSLSNFSSISGINLPENIIQSAVVDDLGGANYSFFSYNQIEGKRLGLIIQTTEEADLSEDLKGWETNIPDYANEFSVYLKDQVLLAATEGFQDNVYNDVAIRYLNFPNPDLSVDYAIVGDKLIITTSRESMYAAIDALLLNDPLAE